MILCLLASFKSFSQTNTESKVVLSETVSREVIKDLVAGDACKKISALKSEKIKNLEAIITSKDSIISAQDKYIDTQNEMLDKPRKIQFHGFVGMQGRKLRTEFLNFYARGMMSIYKVNVGLQYTVIVKDSYAFTTFVEYKLF